MPTSRTMPTAPLTVEAFVEWLDAGEGDERFELLSGRVIEMQAERGQHQAAKAAVFAQLDAQLDFRGPFRPYVDGFALRLPDETVFEPDAFVRCGEALGPDHLVVEDPVLVIEITSPSTSRIDLFTKRTRYFELPSLIHFVVIDLARRVAIHDKRVSTPEAGKLLVETAIEPERVILADLGVTLELGLLFERVAAY